jgi:hypothetical protein
MGDVSSTSPPDEPPCRPASGTRPAPLRFRDQLRDHEEERRRCRSAVPAIAPDVLTSNPSELIPRNVTPDTIAGWQAAADAFLTRRGLRIPSQRGDLLSLCLDLQTPADLLQVGCHGRDRVPPRPAGLFPLRLDADRTGYVDIPRSLLRQKLLRMDDVHVIRATNNAIFHDIFWVHLAYVSADNGIERVRALLDGEHRYAPVLSGFETIDRARRVLEDDSTPTEARRVAEDLMWEGNVQLLEHEQRALVQPCFDRLSCAFARVISLGSATTFEARGVRHEAAYFTSFYLSSLMRGVPHVVGAKGWPRITRFDDRWCWLVASVIPRFRRFDADAPRIDAGLRRIFNEARNYASTPCVLPRPLQTERPGP